MWFEQQVDDDDDGVFVAVDDVDGELPLVDAPDGEEDPELEVGENGGPVSHTGAGSSMLPEAR